MSNILDTSYTFNTSGVYYTFQTELGIGPVISNQFPGANAIDVATDTLISFDITDANDDLDPTTVSIIVDTTLVYENELSKGGFIVVRTAITDGYHYVVTPPIDWPYGSTITAYVFARDYSTTLVSSLWSFTVIGDATCFTGPLNSTEEDLLTPFMALPHCEKLRIYLFSYITTNRNVVEGARAIFLRSYTQEFAPVLHNIVSTPTEEEVASRLCHKATNVAVTNNLRRKTDVVPGAIRELAALGLPREHCALFEAYAQEDQPNTKVPLACVLVLLAKALQ